MDYVEILSWIMRKFYHGVYGYFIIEYMDILSWIWWKFDYGLPVCGNFIMDAWKFNRVVVESCGKNSPPILCTLRNNFQCVTRQER